MPTAQWDAFHDQQILGAGEDTHMNVGDMVTWRYEPRGGYGYVLPIDAEIIRLQGLRAQIRVSKKDGAKVTRWVTVDRLRPHGPNYLSPSARADIDACDEYD